LTAFAPIAFGVTDVDELDLRNHQRSGHRGDESAGVIALPSRIADGSDHRGLLGGHWHQPIDTVDPQIRRDAHRHVQRAHAVLDQAIGDVGRQISGVREVSAFVVGQASEPAHCIDPLGHGQLVEAGDPAVANGIGHDRFSLRIGWDA